MRALGLAAVMLLTLVSPSAFAQPEEQPTQSTTGTRLTINVAGFDIAEPDMATLVLGVTIDDVSASQALAQNALEMNRLIAALRRARVAERDIRTARLAVSPHYNNNSSVIDSFRATNTVSVRVRNLEDMGRLIDAATEAGGNTVETMRFAHSNPTPHLDAARRNGVAEARRRADLYAQSLGMSVASVLSVTEQTYSYRDSDEIVVTASRGSGYAPTPVIPGEITTSVGVNVVFELR